MKFRGILAVLAFCFFLSAISARAQLAVNLVYNADGILVSKTVNGVTTKYLVDDMNPTGLPQVIEETVNGVVERRYTYGKQRISETQLINGVWITSYYGYDAAGNDGGREPGRVVPSKYYDMELEQIALRGYPTIPVTIP
jgi:hypothetical protein